MLWLVLLLAVYLVIVFVPGEKFSMKQDRLGKKGFCIALGVLLAGSLVLRICLVKWFPNAYQVDENCFSAWAWQVKEYGIPAFYNTTSFCDYPPGYLYVLYPIGAMIHAFSMSIEQFATKLLLRLPAILFDLAGVCLLVCAARRRLGNTKAVWLGVLYSLCPMVLLNSCVWGQIDSVWTFFLLCAFVLGTRKKIVPSAFCLSLSVLVKPQALLFMPIFVLLYFGGQGECVKNYAKALLVGAGMFVLASVPFCGLDFGLAASKYFGTMTGGYPYATINAFNLYALLGANWAPIGNRFLFVTYQFWGYVMMAGAVAAGVYTYFKKGKNIYFSAAVLMIFMFLFATMMHERYLYPAVLLLLFAYIESGDREFVGSGAMIGVLNFCNVLLVLLAFYQNTVVQGVPVFLFSALTLAAGLYVMTLHPAKNLGEGKE